MKRTILSLVLMSVLAILAPSTASAYSDVIAGLNATFPDTATVPSQVMFSWQLYMHQDTLITSGLGGTASRYQGGPGGYVTVNRISQHPGESTSDLNDRVVMYGAGNIQDMTVADADGNSDILPVDSMLKVALGNLAVSSIQVLDGDIATDGTASAQDSLTGKILTNVPAAKFADTNNDGFIRYVTSFNFAVVPGSDNYFDYNRDGQISNAPLDSTATDHAISDRPFIAIYESNDGQSIDLSTPPTTNVDGDASGSKTDNLWIGNPFSPMDSDAFAGDPRGLDGASPAGTPEGYPVISGIAGFNSPLLIAELQDIYLITQVNLASGATSYTFITSPGVMDATLTDGRFVQWYIDRAASVDSTAMNASLQFKLSDRFDPMTRYVYRDNGTLAINLTSGGGGQVPEPAGLAFAAIGALGLIRKTRRA